MKWRWYTTWWLLPRAVLSLSLSFTLSFSLYFPLSISLLCLLKLFLLLLHPSSLLYRSFFPFPVSFFYFLAGTRALPRARHPVLRRLVLPLDAPCISTIRSTWISPGAPRAPTTSAFSLAGGFRQIGHRVTGIYSRKLARRSTSTIPPPLVEYRRVVAPCVSSYFALPLRLLALIYAEENDFSRDRAGRLWSLDFRLE